MNRRHRLPTRVSKACDRCRKQKQRCDNSRPCLNCAHARKECTSTQNGSTADQPSPSKRQRVTQRSSPGGPGEINSSTTRSSSPKQHNQPTVERVDSHVSEFATTGSPYSWSASVEAYSASASNGDQDGRNPATLVSPTNHSNNDALASGTSANEPGKSPDASVLSGLPGESTITITRRLLEHGLPSSPLSHRVTSAIPGSDPRVPSHSDNGLIYIRDIVGVELPPRAVCDKLISTYFLTVHWFSLVIYEPKFRSRYDKLIETGMARRSDHCFILLLLIILSMASWYDGGSDFRAMRESYLLAIKNHFMDVIDEDSLEFVQLSALLGSFYLYHGRPRSSFSILGAATKTSQALGLHRQPDRKMPFEDVEERKRVWWTIYTWDRFATIMYGRPLGINDKDCNVAMPAEFHERITSTKGGPDEMICLSTYQIQLNRIYMIASPVLECIYGIRISTDYQLMSRLPNMIANVDASLQKWKQELPVHLSYEMLGDISKDSSAETKMHALQAMSLQLTYDNIIIVMHRTLLADQRTTPLQMRQATRASDGTQNQSTDPDMIQGYEEENFDRCLKSAFTVSQVRCRPNLVELAQDTHLVSFLAMNLFTSSVVMSIGALSDPMSDAAQEAKRGMANTLQLLRAQATRASLPMQYSLLIEDLVGLIFEKEKAAMLSVSQKNLPTSRPSYHETNSLENVQGTLESPRSEGLGQRQHSIGYAHPQAETIYDLQKLFHENNLPNYDVAHSSYPVGASISGTYNSGEETGIPSIIGGQASDIGQFWLWNMEPYHGDEFG